MILLALKDVSKIKRLSCFTSNMCLYYRSCSKWFQCLWFCNSDMFFFVSGAMKPITKHAKAFPDTRDLSELDGGSKVHSKTAGQRSTFLQTVTKHWREASPISFYLPFVWTDQVVPMESSPLMKTVTMSHLIRNFMRGEQIRAHSWVWKWYGDKLDIPSKRLLTLTESSQMGSHCQKR